MPSSGCLSSSSEASLSPLMALKVMVKSGSPGGHEGIWGCGAAADCEIGERAVGGGEMLIHTWRNLIFTSHVGTAYK